MPYKYNVVFFGLKNAPATYQRTMNKVFEQEIKEMLKIYMDAHRLQQIHLKMCPAYTTVLQTIKEGCTIQIDSRVRANLCAIEDNTLSQPPILSRSMIEETLNIYLNVSIEAESVVLVKEVASNQNPVCFISKALALSKKHLKVNINYINFMVRNFENKLLH